MDKQTYTLEQRNDIAAISNFIVGCPEFKKQILDFFDVGTIPHIVEIMKLVRIKKYKSEGQWIKARKNYYRSVDKDELETSIDQMIEYDFEYWDYGYGYTPTYLVPGSGAILTLEFKGVEHEL